MPVNQKYHCKDCNITVTRIASSNKECRKCGKLMRLTRTFAQRRYERAREQLAQFGVIPRSSLNKD